MASSVTLVSHTADVRLRAEGDGPEEALSAALAGLAEYVLGDHRLESRATDSWQATASAPELALVELLSEALFQLQVRNRVVVGLRGEVGRGELAVAEAPTPLEPVREVKAVTYNRPVCERRHDGRWRCEVTLDL